MPYLFGLCKPLSLTGLPYIILQPCHNIHYPTKIQEKIALAQKGDDEMQYKNDLRVLHEVML